MPSTHSYVAGPALPPLCEIIDLEPEKEPWCAGYAPSQGRRCHTRTNAHGRRSAMVLLHEGTKDLRAGRCIDELLKDLAPHVLCTRFHQSQASDLVCRWQRKVRTLLDTQAASIITERQTSRSSRDPCPGISQDNVEERTTLLYRRPRDTMEEIRLIQASLDEPTIDTSLMSDPDARRTSGEIGLSSIRISATRDRYPGIISQDSVTSQSTESVNQSATTPTRLAQAHVDRREHLSPGPGATPTLVSSMARIADETINHSAPNAARQVPVLVNQSVAVIRREVEGECGICLCDLKTPQREEEERQGEVEGDDDDQHDGLIETAGGSEELVWCRARCGINFHKQCIDQWLETAHAATCPACRSNWRH
ncbi:uncharacterized protein N7477_002190 [Penicillium maclennaniae]|uniref:uncharacterized protein n=1 Tax=Penicillium maclennaniae TaxID=1343394 RepID=UPI0025411756|nr:uncharacterized protein N7477_002190 [Penicillium maclennaniae]KAJ5676557.1 hypothetical protein N7477_002190 [Penicillium maclennaniae]